MLVEDASIRWVENPSGPIQIYREPVPGGAYILGADTAGEGSDFNVGQVIDHLGGAQVCTMRGRMDEDCSPSRCTAWANTTTQPW